MLTQVATLAVALLAVSSCGREPRTRTAPESASPSASNQAASTSAAQTPAAEAPAPLPGVFDRLAAEARSRPSGTVTVEDVVAALAAAGDPTEHQQQVLASPLGARYCAVLETRSRQVLSVCEFESPAAARAGLELSRSRFDRLIPGRRFELNGGTLLTVAPRGGDPSADGSAAARELFAALSPPKQERNEQ
jgi:hypothetical protein